ncbi:MAG: hypothetical protein OJJ54_01000 [Pseudonocardia sp.]|nr:hypothetical protein [Pseudonocardia sp.]
MTEIPRLAGWVALRVHPTAIDDPVAYGEDVRAGPILRLSALTWPD